MRNWHRRSGIGLVAAALLGLAAAGTATSSVAAVKPATAVSYYQLVNHDGKCLDIAGGTSNGKVQQWKCNGNRWQYWAVERTSQESYLIKNMHTGRCLSATGTSPGSGTAQGPCSASDVLENWLAEYIGHGAWFEYWVDLTFGGCNINANSECGMHPSGGSSSDGKGIYIQFPNSQNNLDSFYWKQGAKA